MTNKGETHRSNSAFQWDIRVRKRNTSCWTRNTQHRPDELYLCISSHIYHGYFLHAQSNQLLFLAFQATWWKKVEHQTYFHLRCVSRV